MSTPAPDVVLVQPCTNCGGTKHTIGTVAVPHTCTDENTAAGLVSRSWWNGYDAGVYAALSALVDAGDQLAAERVADTLGVPLPPKEA